MLLNFQKKYVIDSDSASDHSSEDENNLIRNAKFNDPDVSNKFNAIQKVKQKLVQYIESKREEGLSEMDKKLLEGVISREHHNKHSMHRLATLYSQRTI